MKKSTMIIVTLAMLSLAACGCKADSVAEPTATPTPTATASPTPAPTETPEEYAQIYDLIEQYKSDTGIDIIDVYNNDPEDDQLPDFYVWLQDNGYTIETAYADQEGSVYTTGDSNEVTVKACTPEDGVEGELVEGYIEWYNDQISDQFAADQAALKESSSNDGLGGTEVIGDNTYTLNSDGSGVDQDGIYYPAWALQAQREWVANRDQVKAEDEARKAILEENGRKAQEAIDSGETTEFAHEIEEYIRSQGLTPK